MRMRICAPRWRPPVVAESYAEYYSARPERLFAEAPPLDLAALGAELRRVLDTDIIDKV